MKAEYNPITYGRFTTICNRKLLRKIESGQIRVIDVMRYAVEKGMLSQKEYQTMDTTDGWRWLATNKIKYEED